MASTQSVQCFGKKKTATAVAHCKVRADLSPFDHRSVKDLFGGGIMEDGTFATCFGLEIS